MSIQHKRHRFFVFVMVLILIASTLPLHALGEVKPINDLESKLEGLSEEEKAVLEDLFLLQQEIDALADEEININDQIETHEIQRKDLEVQIVSSQKNYELRLDILEQVMVNYQRGGPASYLEILLKANNLSEFLMSLNIMKDISHNVNELLISIKISKKELEDEKLQLTEKVELVERKKEELLHTISIKQQLQEEQEEYLASLQEDREYYQNQLAEISQMWSDCQLLFSEVVKELNRIIASGYFTEEDLNLNYGFFTVQGYLEGENFNQVLEDNSSITKTSFLFEEERVVIKVPDKQLELSGYFEIAGDSAIVYVVETGAFYNMPLDITSIKELFNKGPLMIDFNGITGDMVIDIKLKDVWSQDGTLNFVVIPQF